MERLVAPERLVAAYAKARELLLAERNAAGYWTGELASSALSTATAVSALAIGGRHFDTNSQGRFANEAAERRVCELVVAGLRWLAERQNPDGGWGDTDKSLSNVATTMLVRSAFHLTGVPSDHADLMDRAEEYIERSGGVRGVRRRYGKDKTFAAPILTNAALAGLVDWRQVPALPFELACVPQRWYRFVRMPVVSYAIPALVAIGQAKFFHSPPRNPLLGWIRRAVKQNSLRVIEQMQPASGGYLEATPLTSFVVMSLASSGQASSVVVKRGMEFLVASARPDGSWPIDTNLATWVTSLSLNALAGGGEDIGQLGCLDWLLSCQHNQVHPYTGAAPGGWGWSDLSGAVPDADDTPAALLAIANWVRGPGRSPTELDRAFSAAKAGVTWLLDLQNRDGGWPTFCRGWGVLPFDRSGADLTAHAMRALEAWRKLAPAVNATKAWPAALLDRTVRAQQRGFTYLDRHQRDAGYWSPLWFGNQFDPAEDNPVYGTSRVLLAYRDLGKMGNLLARRAVDWLVRAQAPDGGWGGAWNAGTGAWIDRPIQTSPAAPAAFESKKTSQLVSSVEETALAVEALLAALPDPAAELALKKGLGRLVELVENGGVEETSPIGFYFAKLWYYERLYPMIYTVSALGQAVTLLSLGAPPTVSPAAHANLPTTPVVMPCEPS